MGVLDDNRVRQALLAAKIQSFSAELVALQSCRDDDELYSLLIRAVESEPFLMSRVVRVANSVAYAGVSSGHAVGAHECLLRVGLSTGRQIAEDFLIDQALGRIARANRFSRAVWREARVAGNLAFLFREYCEDPFNMPGPMLPSIMSYLAELFIMGLVRHDGELPVMVLPPEPDSGGLDLIDLSMLALSQMQLPPPVENTITGMRFAKKPSGEPYARSSAALLIIRELTKEVTGGQSVTAMVDADAVEVAHETLGIPAKAYAEIVADAKRIARSS